MAMSEITLRDGTVVRCRPVPAYARGQAAMKYRDPQMPTVGQETADGRTEYHPAEIGSPEWSKYQDELADVQRKRAYASRALDYDYGVTEWTVDGQFVTDPPESWKFPKALEKHGVHSTGDKRTDFIAFALLAHPADHDAFMRAIGDQGPLTESEVKAALASFPRDVARRLISKVTSEWGDD